MRVPQQNFRAIAEIIEEVFDELSFLAEKVKKCILFYRISQLRGDRSLKW